MKTISEALLPPLNLPPAALKLRNDDGHTMVLDPLRRRFVRLTPEEWVRQHFTAYLIHEKGYPAGLLGNEVSLTLNGTARRCDTVLYGLDRQPRMIIEYKAPSVTLTQKVFDQICRYNIVLRVEWLIVSNGLQHVVCRLDLEKGTYEFLPQVPLYGEL
ncbi:MAG: type I restriction enzyme HsdR N-terminal domain-containing protein [Bacteroidaceae bacterium]|nr:type I restriction enzyme HsdR N-terminal domain-containing protein [Bacteroidaceae bacterium]